MTQEQIVAALVNPLAWIPYETDDGTRGVHADATFGKYLCVPSGWFLVGQTGWMDETDLEAAKAAAQADYEARILAAVEAVDLRPIREALECINRVLHFDLRRMIEFGDDYNQAVKDAADAATAALQAIAGDSHE